MSTYLDTRDALFDLIDGQQFAGQTVAAFYELPLDFAQQAQDTAAVLIYTTGGTEGYVDRVDRATIDVYAPGTSAVAVAEAIRSAIVDRDHDTAAGYVDNIATDVSPVDIPYQSDLVHQARVSLLVTSRPID